MISRRSLEPSGCVGVFVRSMLGTDCGVEVHHQRRGGLINRLRQQQISAARGAHDADHQQEQSLSPEERDDGPTKVRLDDHRSAPELQVRQLGARTVAEDAAECG